MKYQNLIQEVNKYYDLHKFYIDKMPKIGYN